MKCGQLFTKIIMDGLLEGSVPSLPSLDWSRCATASVHTWCPAPPRPGQAAGHIIRSAAPGHVSTTGCVSHVSHVSSVCSHDVTAGSGLGWAGLGWAGALNLIICRNLEKAGPWLGPDQTVAASTSRAWARSDLISCGASHLVPSPSPSLHGHHHRIYTDCDT